MIRINEGGLADLWPEKESPEILALSYAIKTALDAARSVTDQTQVYANLDNVQEKVLDYLAAEMRTMYYDSTLDVETKKTIIKNTLKWYGKAGTTSSVKELMVAAFGYGDIEEWYTYEGDPYHFRAVLLIGDGQAAEAMRKFASFIESIKNVRSRFDALIFEEKTTLKLKTGESAYKTDPPLCGTLPFLSTAYASDGTIIDLSSGEGSGQTIMPLSGEINTENE